MRGPLGLALVLALAAAAPAATPASADVQDVIYLGDSGPLLIRLHVRLDGKPLRTVWQEGIGRIFTLLDRDGDGVLSKEEVKGIPPIEVLFAANPGQFFNAQSPSLAALDTSGDGKVSRAELLRYYQNRAGAEAFQLRVDGPANAMANRVVVDAGGNVFYSATNGAPPAVLDKQLFEVLDRDKDGKLSARELAAASTVLGKFDSNEDELVSQAELLGQQTNDSGTVDLLVANAYAAFPQAPSPSFVAVPSGKRVPSLAQQLLARYGSKDSKTGQPTGRSLSREQLGMTQTAFRQIDADNSGALDREELARFHHRDADMELLVRVGKTGKDEAYLERHGRSAAGRKAAQLQRNVDGSFSLEQGATRLEVHRLQEERDRIAPRRAQLNYKAMFLQTDQDKNGYLDMQEARRNPFFGSLFARMDRDGDGKLFEKEIVAYLDQMSKMQEVARDCCVSLHASDQGQGLFSLADSNRDGRLGLRELRQMARLVERLDRDADDKIATNELPQTYRLDLSRGPSTQPRPGGAYRVSLRVQGNNPQPAQPARAGPVWFAKMDRNGDGDVSRREFLGTEEQFRQIDGDGDGLISLEEARKADEALRKERGGSRR